MDFMLDMKSEPAVRAGRLEETTQMISGLSLAGAISGVAAISIPLTHMVVYGVFNALGI